MQDAIAAALRDMLGAGVGIGVTDPRAELDDLLPQERSEIARAIPKRQYEFAAGRRAARHAMADLGLPPVAIPVGAQRAPIWPKGLTGSIAHCDDICIAVVSPSHRSIGIDIEPDTPLPADLIDIVCMPQEQDTGADPKQIFCAKEAVYKAQYPLTGQVIGFDAVIVTLTADRFSAQLGDQTLTGSIRTVQSFIIATCTVT